MNNLGLRRLAPRDHAPYGSSRRKTLSLQQARGVRQKLDAAKERGKPFSRIRILCDDCGLIKCSCDEKGTYTIRGNVYARTDGTHMEIGGLILAATQKTVVCSGSPGKQYLRQHIVDWLDESEIELYDRNPTLAAERVVTMILENHDIKEDRFDDDIRALVPSCVEQTRVRFRQRVAQAQPYALQSDLQTVVGLFREQATTNQQVQGLFREQATTNQHVQGLFREQAATNQHVQDRFNDTLALVGVERGRNDRQDQRLDEHDDLHRQHRDQFGRMERQTSDRLDAMQRENSSRFEQIERTIRGSRILPTDAENQRDHMAPSKLFESPQKLVAVTPGVTHCQDRKPSPVNQDGKASPVKSPVQHAPAKRDATTIPEDQPLQKKAKGDGAKEKKAKKKVVRAYKADSTPFNEPLRFPSKMTAEKSANIDLLRSALTELPDYEGPVVRGTDVLDMPFEEVQTTGVYINTAFMSAAKDEVCRSFFDTKYYLIIQCKSGKSIEKVGGYKHEKEVLYLPGKRFRVTKIESREEGRFSIYLEELD